MERSSHSHQRLNEAVTDGRLANVFYRQEQLSRLRDSLVKNRDAILTAIIEDSKITYGEAKAELFLTLSAIKNYHDELDSAEVNKTEYRVAEGRDATEANEGAGIVMITSISNHSFVYSLLTPLCSAIAAGNAVVIVLQQTLRSAPSIVQKILTEALDQDIIEIVTSDSHDTTNVKIRVVQNETNDSTAVKTVFSQSSSPTVAVVDRTANIDEAAKALVDARMEFNGRSPYAPDVVLVNEFAKEAFLNAVLRHSIRHMARNGGNRGESLKDIGKGRNSFEQPKEDRNIRTITSGSYGSVLDIIDREVLSQKEKVTQKALYVHAVSSLDDAIEVANGMTKGPALAAYAFGDLPSCKYLLQFIRADVGFANMIPTEILIGPAAPRGCPVQLSTRYPSSLFSIPCPKYAERTELSARIRKLMDTPESSRGIENELMSSINLKERAPIKHIDGYFERAAVVGLVTFITPVILGSAALVFRTLRWASFQALK